MNAIEWYREYNEIHAVDILLYKMITRLLIFQKIMHVYSCIISTRIHTIQ